MTPFREENWTDKNLEDSHYCCCFFIDPLAVLASSWSPAYAWCEEQFGPGHELGPIQSIDGVRWFYVTDIAFGFHREDDAFEFKMRWGGSTGD